MPPTEKEVGDWCLRLVEKTPYFPPLEECLGAIPTLNDLADLLAGTRARVRGDTNVAFDAEGRADDESRLLSLLETLRFGVERGRVWVLQGHQGTDDHPSLRDEYK